MRNIRSITLGINWDDISSSHFYKKANDFIEQSCFIFKEHNYKIRTCRLTMPPLNSYPRFSIESANSIINSINQLCSKIGLRWFCIPFSAFEDVSRNECSRIAIDLANRYKNAFINFIVTQKGTINKSGIYEASACIKAISRMSNNGFDNFRVGVSSECKPNTPFFPFSFHEGESGFSIALETVNLFIDIIKNKYLEGIGAVELSLIKKLTKQLTHIDKLGELIEQKTRLKYLGIDASLAPFPNGHSSVARIIELLGVESFGSNGSLFFTSFLTNIIKHAIKNSGAKSIGFNGVMYSVLEDDVLAKRNIQKNITLDGLILYSSVCGCGVDMVPVPGDMLEEEINSLILDVSGMAITLNKPLGIRILPIPTKAANELTNFNHDFLIDTRILGVRNRCHSKQLFTNDTFNYYGMFRDTSFN